MPELVQVASVWLYVVSYRCWCYPAFTLTEHTQRVAGKECGP